MLETLLIDLPEVFVMYNMSNALLENKLKFKQIAIITLICVIIGNIGEVYLQDSLRVILIFSTSYILLCLSIKEHKVKCLISLIITYAIKFTIEFMFFIVLNLGNVNIEKMLDNQLTKILFIDITVFFTYIIYLIIKKKNINIIKFEVKKPKKVVENKSMTTVLIILSCINILLVQVIAVEIMNNLEIYGVYSRFNLVVIGVIIWVVFCICCLVITALIVEKSKDNIKLENNLIRGNLKQMQETVDLLRIQRHDYMNHLQVVLMQISKNKNDDARRYILGLSDEVKKATLSFDTGSNYIDAILNFKSARCSEHNIELTACIDSTLEGTLIEETELSSIFLNIIDNAIDELKKNDKDYRFIHVDTYTDNKKHFISISNNGRKIENTKKIFEKGYSSKGDNRGYGLYSIKQMLLSYKSNIVVASDDESTEFLIEIPIVDKSLCKI